MAPSVTEPIFQTAEQIREKLAPSASENPDKVEGKAHEALDIKQSATPVQATTPVAQGQHREPLKLSGALDKFESFDVTPIIGREYVGVNLADWLKAPNSDELLRDLAITSKIHDQYIIAIRTICLHAIQYPNEVSCSSENKMI